jgi:hypothetical protein
LSNDLHARERRSPTIRYNFRQLFFKTIDGVHFTIAFVEATNQSSLPALVAAEGSIQLAAGNEYSTTACLFRSISFVTPHAQRLHRHIQIRFRSLGKLRKSGTQTRRKEVGSVLSIRIQGKWKIVYWSLK